MAKTLTITDERVKEAAASCPDAKRVLEKMFPDVFVQQDEYMMVPNELTGEKSPFTVDGKPITLLSALARRSGAEFRGKGIYLCRVVYPSHGTHPIKLDWSVVKDSQGESVLVAKIVR